MAGHSLVGASGAHRWLECPGSVGLIKTFGPPQGADDETEFSREGTAEHEALALLLRNPEMETWEVVGQVFNGVEITPEMADAIDVGVQTGRKLMSPGTVHYIEERLTHPDDPNFRGTIDLGTASDSLITSTDYKGGAGISVEAVNNPQQMYYAYLLILRHPSARRVVIRIVQPRIEHPDGPVRRWETTAEHICQWVEETLIPGMRRAQSDGTLKCGEHCRFCPAKLICPLLNGLFEAAATQSHQAVVSASSDVLAQNYKLVDNVRMYCKAIEDEVERRILLGQAVPGFKIVQKRGKRVWKPEAMERLVARYGGLAMTEPELKSPAQMEKLPDAKPLVNELAYAPDNGFTFAEDADRRPAIRLPSATEVFKSYSRGE